MSIYVPSNQIILNFVARNLLTSSKAVPLCLKQILVVRTSLIQISDTRTSFLTILRFLCVIFFIICHDFNPSVWHTQRMKNFVTIFLCRFFSVDFSLPCGIALKAMPHGSEKSPELCHTGAKNRQRKIVTIFVIRCVCHTEGLKSWQIMKKMTHKNLK